jgi:hypothetical protein
MAVLSRASELPTPICRMMTLARSMVYSPSNATRQAPGGPSLCSLYDDRKRRRVGQGESPSWWLFHTLIHARGQDLYGPSLGRTRGCFKPSLRCHAARCGREASSALSPCAALRVTKPRGFEMTSKHMHGCRWLVAGRWWSKSAQRESENQVQKFSLDTLKRPL